LSIKDQLPYNNPNISFAWQAGLAGVFAFEGILSLAWSWVTLSKAKAAGELAVTGPYAFIRHPIFATILWDGTGCLVFCYKAWIVVLALVPLSMVWSYLASLEEDYLKFYFGKDYLDHFAHKGQLFPSFKGIEQDTIDY
jgi:protein-S-isoprenylcysteine O-methyltransferase Ste14